MSHWDKRCLVIAAGQSGTVLSEMAGPHKIQGPGENPWDVNFEDLENLRDLSSGNFGKVFRGTYFGTEVAVKKLLDVDDEFMHKYIEREMAILKSLRHPNIVQFMGLSKHRNDYYIVTEFISGGDLRHLLKDHSKELSWKMRVKMALDTAQALTFLHSKGLMHRDLKSHNLLVDENGKIKLCDFGFSRRVGDTAEQMTLCGTDEWMAPEVMLGEKYDTRADVFSFGMVVTELITRQKPAKRAPGRRFAFDAEAFRPLVPRSCPPDLVQIAIDCTQWDPHHRPVMKEVLERLKALNASIPDDVPAAPPSASSSPMKKSDRSGNEMTYMSGVEVVVEDDDPPKKPATHSSSSKDKAAVHKDPSPPKDTSVHKDPSPLKPGNGATLKASSSRDAPVRSSASGDRKSSSPKKGGFLSIFGIGKSSEKKEKKEKKKK